MSDDRQIQVGIQRSNLLLFTRALRVFQKRLYEYYEAHGYDIRHIWVLMAMRDLPTFQGAIADALGVNRNVMVRIVDQMEKIGLVQRRRNPKNRKEVKLVPTKQGKKVLKWTLDNFDKANERLFHPLNAEELSIARKYARRIVESD